MRFCENILYDNKNNPIIKTFHSSVLPQKRLFNMHHHTECELSLFISGSGIYSVKNKQYTFHAGDIFLFGSDEAHCITEIFKELDLLNIHFEPRVLWQYPEALELLNLFHSRNSNFTNKFSGDDVVLKNIILDIEAELSEKKTGYKIQTKHNLFSALIHIMREYNYIEFNNNPSQNTTTTKSLTEAINYIQSHLYDQLTLEEIATIAHMTKNHFSYIFKKFNGISLWNYITIKRVEAAIELLKTTNLTKIEIAEKCGFTSSSNFYKAFKQVTGMQPKDYLSEKK